MRPATNLRQIGTVLLALSGTLPAAAADQKPVSAEEQTDAIVRQLGAARPSAKPEDGKTLMDELTGIVAEALDAGKPASEVRMLLENALDAESDPAALDALRGADGKIDITNLIAALVLRSGKDAVSDADKAYVETLLAEGQSGAAGKPKTVVVQAGDTLSSIARQHYGDPDAYVRILAANKSKLRNPNIIEIGTELVIPE